MVYLIRITEFDNNKQISRMKKFLNTAAAFIAALLLITGCSPETPPERISRIGKTAMGEVIFPRNGEGELLEVSGNLPGGFDRMLAEVVPFDHRVFRMVLENAEAAGTHDPLESSAGILGKRFNIKFSRVDDNTMRSELPGTIVILRRGFYLGPRGVVLEITDRELQKQTEELKNSPRFRQYRRYHLARNGIILLARSIADFKLDNGSVPEKIADLTERPAGCLTWNGPYCHNPPSTSVVYRRISVDSYELYQEVDGKRINEDTEL